MYFSKPSSPTSIILAHLDEEINEENNETSDYDVSYNSLNYVSRMLAYIEAKRLRILEIRNEIPHIPDVQRACLEMKVRQAEEMHKVFTLMGYYPAVRYELKQLGWVEKIDPKKSVQDVPLRTSVNVLGLESAPLIMRDETQESISKQYHERKLMSDMIETQADLLFSLRKGNIVWSSLEPHTVVSCFQKVSFCSKIGLNMCLEGMDTFNTKNNSLKFPRGHGLLSENSLKRFTQIFREFSCFGLMRFVKHNYEKEVMINSLDGNIPWSIFYFAENFCKKRIRCLQLELVDNNTPDRFVLVESEEEANEWAEFGEDFFNLTAHKSSFRYVYDLQPIYMRAKKIVDTIEELDRQEMFNGMHNIWVIKPLANCSGHGIRFSRRIEEMKKDLYPLNINSHFPRYVFQKYIERPLLVNGVKMDLRLWFIITNINQFKIWVYHEGYVRFCSKPHSNIVLDERRHLANVRVQRKYRRGRDPNTLPEELMWDFQQLNEYFATNMNMPSLWEKIMREMEESITTVVECALHFKHLTLRQNAFQLFGADFLIHENLQPCLIEVNNGPGLSPTSSIIAKKVTELLRDMTRVVTQEMSTQPSDDLGNFHLTYVKHINPNVLEGKEQTIIQTFKTTAINLEEWKKNVNLKAWKTPVKKLKIRKLRKDNKI